MMINEKAKISSIVLTTTGETSFQVGDFVTLTGIPLPRRRWWQRAIAWVLRLPPVFGPYDFYVTKVSSYAVTLTQPTEAGDA